MVEYRCKTQEGNGHEQCSFIVSLLDIAFAAQRKAKNLAYPDHHPNKDNSECRYSRVGGNPDFHTQKKAAFPCGSETAKEGSIY